MKRPALTAFILAIACFASLGGTWVMGPGKGYHASAFTANASDFDGTNDHLARGSDLSGNADGQSGIVSLWFNAEAGTFQKGIIDTANNRFIVQITNDRTVRVRATNSSGTIILNMESTGTYDAGGGWHHVLAAWNLATPVARLYIDGSDVEAGGSTETSATIDYTDTNWEIGRIGGSANWNGCLAEVYLHVGTTLDISNSTNREKFRSSGGLPVDLGADGSTPTSSQPIIYLHNTTATFQTNLGSGGNFTVTGSLDACGSTP
jgi:hypothetical protein